eukprot:COSAG02_NODE_856_length_16468_cov_131.787831_8_plen_40_part_00
MQKGGFELKPEVLAEAREVGSVARARRGAEALTGWRCTW